MPKKTFSRKLAYRALLTETLPYEVPAIFSNDIFYASTVREPKSIEIKEALRRLRERRPHSIPYNYKIRKDREQWNTLSIVHPVNQIQMSEFYDAFSNTILESTKRSSFTLRRPNSVARIRTASTLSEAAAPKLGIPHNATDINEIDASRIVSYFVYRPFNLLGKFFDSRDILSLERRFSYMRRLDVTKCFFNIYTHTVTWAVKEKTFAKRNRNNFSFEGAFDKLMQQANHNETNGIVVGPEISRIFAEIILQDVDRKISSDLQRNGLARDAYEIRRYLDDYFIFARSVSDLDKIQSSVQAQLEAYKLFLNERKIEDFRRPFVSSITLAKREITSCSSSISEFLKWLAAKESPAKLRSAKQTITRDLLEYRSIVARHSVGFHNLSARLLAELHGGLRQILSSAILCDHDDEKRVVLEVAQSLFHMIAHICALDIRVRTTYMLAQIVSTIDYFGTKLPLSLFSILKHTTQLELIEIIESSWARARDHDATKDCIEIFNLLITGACFFGESFVKIERIRLVVQSLCATPTTYFQFISLKFAMLRAPDFYKAEIDQLNERVKVQIQALGSQIFEDAEGYLMFCDFISSPDIALKLKVACFKNVCPGSISSTAVKELGEWIGFTDWTGLRVYHLLKRKQLRPVYGDN